MKSMKKSIIKNQTYKSLYQNDYVVQVWNKFLIKFLKNV